MNTGTSNYIPRLSSMISKAAMTRAAGNTDNSRATESSTSIDKLVRYYLALQKGKYSLDSGVMALKMPLTTSKRSADGMYLR